MHTQKENERPPKIFTCLTRLGHGDRLLAHHGHLVCHGHHWDCGWLGRVLRSCLLWWLFLANWKEDKQPAIYFRFFRFTYVLLLLRGHWVCSHNTRNLNSCWAPRASICHSRSPSSCTGPVPLSGHVRWDGVRSTRRKTCRSRVAAYTPRTHSGCTCLAVFPARLS